MEISSISKILCMIRDITIKSFPNLHNFGKNDFVLFSRCPISIYAKVEKLTLLFSDLLGHTFQLNV